MYGIYKTENLTNKQIKKYEMTEKKIFKKYANLSEDELNTKSSKNVLLLNVAEVKKRCI